MKHYSLIGSGNFAICKTGSEFHITVDRKEVTCEKCLSILKEFDKFEEKFRVVIMSPEFVKQILSLKNR